MSKKKEPAGSCHSLPVLNSKTCPVVTELKTKEFYHKSLLKSRILSIFRPKKRST